MAGGKSSGWALVTGASSGLGVAFAHLLAERGHDLVLAARREAPMQELAAQLQAAHGIRVVVEPADLAQEGSAERLDRRLAHQGIEPTVLLNNAAFGLSGRLIDQDAARLRALMQVDMVALTELSHLFGRRMAARREGQILLVASIAAYQPVPLLAAYAAAKAYVLALGEALNAEHAPSNVRVTVLSPGLMATEFFDVSGYKPPVFLKPTMLPAAEVARIGLDAMRAGKPSIVAGRLNRISMAAARLIPRRHQARLAFRFARH